MVALSLGAIACGPAAESSAENPGGSGATGDKGYESHPVVPGDTTPESSAPTPVQSGQPTRVSLSDGTTLTFPALKTKTGDGPVTNVVLGRETNDIDLGAQDQQSTGSMRVVTFDSFDPVARGLIAANVAPVLTIPAKELGAIDHGTINVARVADLVENGQVVQTVSFLPATWDEAGNLLVRDYMFPDSIAADLELAAGGGVKTATRKPAPAGYVPRPRRITYVAGTFQGSANWARGPQLVRMVPVAEVPEKRQPVDRLPGDKRQLVANRCFHTAVVLVHGHNEEEGVGFSGASVEEPWRVSYKRDVWTHLYEQALNGSSSDCVRYYEFVYPSYRAIFTPQNGRERLDEAFSRQIAQELKPQLDAKMPIQLMIVAHSMGGLVARAGVQLLSPPLQSSLSEVVTWGTPHLGSPLVSLRYLFAAVPGYDARSGLVSVGLDNVDNTLYSLRRAVAEVQVDSPGTRDLRWSPSATTTPRDLAFDKIFELSVDQVGKDQFFDLVNGPWLYNQNLQKLNGEDIYRNAERYVALFGVTSKRAKVTFPLSNWFRPRIEPPSDIAIGATAISWLVNNPTELYAGVPQSSGDGASSVASLAGAGVVQLSRALNAGDIDHEEYFGAPTAPGQFRTRPLALGQADLTWRQHRFGDCPPFRADLEDDTWNSSNRWTFNGDVYWPGTTTPGALVKAGAGIKMRIAPAGSFLNVQEFVVTPEGRLSGWVDPKTAPEDVFMQSNNLLSTITFVDGTEASVEHSPDHGCVTAETEVAMVDGARIPISQLHRGDMVLAYDDKAPGGRTQAKVQRVLRHHGSYPIHRLSVAGVGDGSANLEVTGNHPVLTVAGGYLPVDSLQAGDQIYVFDPREERVVPRPIAAIVRDVSKRGIVYNLKTSRGQYIASEVVVHNKCVAAGSPVDTPAGPRPVETLVPGDAVWTLRDGVRIRTTVTHAYTKTTALPWLPGRVLSGRAMVTDNHPLVRADGSTLLAGNSGLPAARITGPVYDLGTADGTYLVDGVLVRGGE